MNSIKTSWRFATTLSAVLAACAAPSLALAHTNPDHRPTSGPVKKEPVKKEQMAWGIAGDAKAVQQTVHITMTDRMRFTPDTLQVKQGQTVRIVIKNQGAMLHEFVLGTKTELDAHAALMLKFPTMEHSQPYMAHVAPGQSGQIIWTFNRAGEFDFACLIAGHYQAGMVGKVKVLTRTATALQVPSAALVAVVDSSVQKLAAPTNAASAVAADMTDGEVRRIDRESGKITLKHGEIKNLDMPGMTMVFVVKDKAMLDKLKTGDKVKFKASNEAGKFTVTEIVMLP